ncbi:MAG: OmpA family protein, partial [Bacteroidia bacterium]
ISLAENDASLPEGTKIILTNKSGKQLNVLNSGAKGDFKFSLLASDKATMDGMKVADADLLISLAGNIMGTDKKPLGKVNVFLVYYNKTAMIDTSKTDSTGTFKFNKLQAAGNYVLNVDENDANLKKFDKVYITDLKGKIIRELIRSKNKGFSFNLLQADKSTLKSIYVEDPWLEVLNMKESKKKEGAPFGSITIVENVYYALNAYKFDEGGQRVLDKVIQIMKNNPSINIEISSHTDSQGDDKNNLLLSQKRAKFSVDYLIAHGVDKKRLKSIGYGESMLINKCGNNVQCLEEEHAKNRRTEFKIIDTSKK